MKIQIVSFLLVLVTGYAAAQEKKYPEIDVPYKEFTLSNGLRVIITEDHKAPIVAVNIWYHVGAKNEKAGKTGFAHLYEHMMFNGSEHNPGGYIKMMEGIGATDLNGTTNNDRTNFFENVPKSAFDVALWAESDRMGYLLGAVDQKLLDVQRGVVQNEKRQGENQPYSKVYDLIAENTYPAEHPYSHTVIGSMDDLNAASLEDVKQWFRDYYGPNNAVLVIAGDVNTDEALNKVKKYFGSIPACAPIARQKVWIPENSVQHTVIIQDRVPQERLNMVWHVPQYGSKATDYLQLYSAILTNGKMSRLFKRLQYDDELVTSIYSFVDQKEIASQFYVIADLKPGVSMDKVKSIIAEEMKKLNDSGPAKEELERAKTQYFSSLLKGLERIGGFGGKSDLLAQSAVFGGSPDYYKKELEWMKNAAPADIQKTAKQWINDGYTSMEVYPYGDYDTTATDIDRKVQPALAAMSDISFPHIRKATLSNGMKVYLVERNSLPVISMRMIVNSGFAGDDPSLPGAGSLTMNLLQEGTRTRSSLQISSEAADLGADIYTDAGIDFSNIFMNALKVNFDKSLDLYSDIIQHPAFPQKDFDRIKPEQLLAIKQEEAQPYTMGQRILPKLIYGANNIYSAPLTGTGTGESVKKITVSDLKYYYNKWFAPNNATLLVVGDISMDELKSRLEAKFGGWKEKTVPVKNISSVALAAKPSVYIIDKPGAEQSIIYAAHISAKGNDPDWDKMEMANRIIGGDFSSRLNMNLREDKHWSYGSGSYFFHAQGQGIFIGYAPVQTDKTKEAIIEFKKEMEAFVSTKPITEQEFDKFRKNAVMQLPGSWETNDAVSYDMSKMVKYGVDENYLYGYAQMMRDMQMNDLREVAKKQFHPSNITWVIVGDRAKIEEGIKSLKLGPVKYVNTDGDEVK